MRVRLVAALSAVLIASMPAALVRGQAETQREPAIAQYQKVSEHLDWFGAKELDGGDNRCVVVGKPEKQYSGNELLAVHLMGDGGTWIQFHQPKNRPTGPVFLSIGDVQISLADAMSGNRLGIKSHDFRLDSAIIFHALQLAADNESRLIEVKYPHSTYQFSMVGFSEVMNDTLKECFESKVGISPSQDDADKTPAEMNPSHFSATAT